MTDYIEEMMKTADVKRRIPECFECFVNTLECTRTIDECPRLYPSFTATKQLEIIQLIAENEDDNTYALAIDRDKFSKEYCFLYQFYTGDDGGLYKEKIILNKDFTQAVAQLTTELMKAGEPDKKKVKEILER